MKKVSLITDGSCLGNPGPGGLACVFRFGAVKSDSIRVRQILAAPQ
jgi:ribonuclease HI